MRAHRILLEASIELEQAAFHYGKIRNRHGLTFLDEYERALIHLLEWPETCAEMSNGYRRSLLRRFPYGIIFKTTSDSIVIYAIMHLARRPNYWLRRS